MAQRVRLDRLGGLPYLALMLAAGCRPVIAPVIPAHAEAVSTDSVAAWVAGTVPNGRILHRFKWLYRDERSSVGGRGSARLAAPDSLRFDVAGPLGANPAAAMVVGDSAIWLDAPGSLSEIVPSYPLLWSAFGVARPPHDAVVLSAGRVEGTVVWRVAAGADTIDYALTRGTARRLIAELRRGGAVVARMDAAFGPTGIPLKARLSVPARPARLDLTFTASDSTARFPTNVWRPRTP